MSSYYLHCLNVFHGMSFNANFDLKFKPKLKLDSLVEVTLQKKRRCIIHTETMSKMLLARSRLYSIPFFSL